MLEADEQKGLRIGGWIPPYAPQERTGAAPRPLGRRGRRPRIASARPITQEALPDGHRRPRRPLLALAGAFTFAVACYAVAAVVVMGTANTPDPKPVAALPPVRPPVSALPSLEVTPTPTPSRSEQYRKVSNTKPAERRNASPSHTAPPSKESSPTPSAPAPSTSSTPVAATSPRVGDMVGLSVVDRPSYRVRHRNFLGRVDAITSASSRIDRADSRFVVRAGRADSGCVSFESVNYPGYFLRHRSFAIRLDRADGTALFDRDATFCAVPVRAGQAFALRSVNYPTRHIVAVGDSLRLEETAAQRATALRDTASL